MVIVQQNSKRKPTGGMHSTMKKMRKHEMGGDAIKTTIGVNKLKKARTKGGNIKLKLRATEFANLIDQIAKTTKKVKITDVLENHANPHFVRQKVITCGAIIQTESGKARVTSRPGQDGIVNAVKVE
ncbi:MAG: 30S ribosomal protein S8e [Nanoarchaeota archaeon]|nr:30S ribosomal protein S8e [Nanoarchaeota archaeon]MBU4451362.1 30S ribosomal protein S8e [Nanoarchaeota archaeon]MCG2723765.1 30S ribosomal protein S8e [archaeon]